MTLADAVVGRWLVVLGFQGSPAVPARLSPLGLLPGSAARVVRRGPLGGAILVEAGGRSIAVGRSVARQVLVRESDFQISPMSVPPPVRQGEPDE